MLKFKFNKDKLKGIMIGSIITGIMTTSLFSFASMESIQAFFNGIQIQVNGKTIETGNDKPFVYNGRTYVPARYIAEGLGATVKWNESDNKIEINSVIKETYTPPLKPISVDSELQNYKVLKLGEGKYVGDTKDNIPNGYGICYYNDGKVYFGSWINGKREGSGTAVDKDGSKYIGEFKNNKTNDKGIFITSDNKIYMGEISNDKFNGKGLFIGLDNEYYMGNFENNSMTGIGTYHYKNGCSYYGSILNSSRNGFGIFVSDINQVTSGMWNQDKYVYSNNPVNGNTNTITNSNNTVNSNNTTTIITTPSTTTTNNQAYLAEKKKQFEQDLSNLKATLNNVKNEKSAKVLVNGAWEYQANPNDVARAEKAYNDKLNQYNLWKAANGM